MKTKVLLFIGILVLGVMIIYSSTLIETRKESESDYITMYVPYSHFVDFEDDYRIGCVTRIEPIQFNETYYIWYQGYLHESTNSLSWKEYTSWTKYAKLTNNTGCYYYYSGPGIVEVKK